MEKYKLLLVEDEEDLVEVILFELEDEGICEIADITVARDGLEGLDLINNNDYDCILSDINMPNMNGLDMAKKLQDEGYKKPIIFISGHGDSETVKVINDLNVFGMVPKPYVIEDLVSEIKKAFAS